jgi:hypothetical protein
VFNNTAARPEGRRQRMTVHCEMLNEIKEMKYIMNFKMS